MMAKLGEGIGDSVRQKTKRDGQGEVYKTVVRNRNERIRETNKVGEISKKLQEIRLKWCGQVFIGEDEHVGRRVMVMEVPGKEGEEDLTGGGWITSSTNCRRENCQGRKRKIGLNGGIS